MAQKVFSVKVEDDVLAALELLADERNTTRNALVNEAINALLAGGLEKIMQERLMSCLKNILGFQDKEGFTAAVEEQFGVMLVDLIDSRLKVLFSVDLAEDLQAGSLAALVAAQRPKPKESIDIKAALGYLNTILATGESVALDDLAGELQADKQVLAKALSDAGIKTERKRIGGGERRQYFMRSQEEAIKKALEEA
jgi:hypothetical protein